MHGQGCEERQERRRMRPAPSQRPASSTVSDFSGGKCFSKDGRTINIGDCALFQAGNAPPFIGIIRDLTTDKEGDLNVVVNWLYRPADIRLVKGVPVEVAPNEIFYSFHRDEISGVSLLHPCKVAFLRKGIELPPGVSSFVCRRVYDTATKRLWWLTDRDYTDDHQEEVDQLLDRTNKEMQATVQSERHSPRSHAGSTSSHQPKLNSEVIQNVPSPIPGKSRKRERTDQSSDSCKRERLMRMDDSDSCHLKRERCVKPEEIASIIDKDGGLLNLSSVDQLVHLMQQDSGDCVKRPADVASRRMMLAGIIASTVNEECLNQFVQLGGLAMLNDWLQEAHKGKDGGSPKEGDKGVEELLLTLLQALDKLPVDLDALKKCIVGKSVNNLRSHKNIEIQKKARKLVDTWKKRVNAEMKLSGDLKTVANPTPKQSSVEPSHMHSMKVATASEVTPKSIPALRAVANGAHIEDSVPKTLSNSVNGGKPHLLAISSKEQHSKVHTGGLTETVSIGVVKEERSSNSSQSQNNSPSCSSGPVKGSSSIWKEDVRTSSAISGGSKANAPVRNNITSGKCHLLGSSGAQRESVCSKPLVWGRVGVHEKVANSGLAEKGSSENLKAENMNNQRLIVRLPNPGRSPARTASGGSVADLTTSSRCTSPSLSERHDVVEGKNKMINSSQIVNTLDVGIDSKCGHAGKFELGSGDDKEVPSPATPPDLAECRTVEVKHAFNVQSGDGRKGTSTAEVSGVVDTCTGSSGFPSVDADDTGIDLLASVAANESCEPEKCDDDVPTESYNTLSNRCIELASEMKLSMEADHLKLNQKLVRTASHRDEKEIRDDNCVEGRSYSSSICDVSEVEVLNGSKKSAKFSAVEINGSIETNNDQQVGSSKENKMIGEGSGEVLFTATLTSADSSLVMDKSLLSKEDGGAGTSNSDGYAVPMEEIKDTGIKEETVSTKLGTTKQQHQQSGADAHMDNAGSAEERCKDAEVPDTKGSPLVRVCPTAGVPRATDAASHCYEEDALEIAQQVAKDVEQEVEHGSKPDQQDSSLPTSCKAAAVKEVGALTSETNSVAMVENSTDECVPGIAVAYIDDKQRNLTEKREGRDVERASGALEGKDVDQVLYIPSNVDGTGGPVASTLGTSVDTCKRAVCTDKHSHLAEALLTRQVAETRTTQAIEVEKADDFYIVGPTIESESSSRPLFDLNEDILDESLPDDVAMTTNLVNPAISFHTVASAYVPAPNYLAAPVAVVAATKGPFIPPSNSFLCKGELGWKGSAATSAFRPAEPRRMPERPQCTTDVATVNVLSSGISRKRSKPLNIDLNVADERVLEDVTAANAAPLQGSVLCLDVQACTLGSCSQLERKTIGAASSTGGTTNSGSVANGCYTVARPELDLNRVDESEENAVPLISDSMCGKMRALGTSITFSSVVRDFDLNDGPSLDDGTNDDSAVQRLDNNHLGVSTLSSHAGLRMCSEVNGSRWFSSDHSLSTLTMPSFPTARAESLYPIASTSTNSVLNAGSSFNPFNGDLYKTGALKLSGISYSTTVPAAFPRADFTLGSEFPLCSTTFATSTTPYLDSSGSNPFPALASQLVSAGAVVSPYGRPFVMSVPEVSATESTAPWSRPNLDLNAGPELVDVDAREEGMVARQACGFSQLSFQHPGIAVGTAKRKEPEGGFDPFRPGFKQMTWH